MSAFGAEGVLVGLLSSTLVAGVVGAALSYRAQRAIARLSTQLAQTNLIHAKRVESYEALWSIAMTAREARAEAFDPETVGNLLTRIRRARELHGLYLTPAVVQHLQIVRTLLETALAVGAVTDDDRQALYEAALELQDCLRTELRSELPAA